jgi:transposase InsO family protein
MVFADPKAVHRSAADAPRVFRSRPLLLEEGWRSEDNTVRSHSALGYLTPTDYAKAWTTASTTACACRC